MTCDQRYRLWGRAFDAGSMAAVALAAMLGSLTLGGLTLGGLTLGLGATALPAGAMAQNLDYRSPSTVPPAWSRFAMLVQYRFKQWLAADNEVAYRFHLYLENRVINEPGPLEPLVVAVWISGDGKVQRVDFPALPDKQANADLHLILERGDIGEPPPPDMLQPLRLKLALDWRS
jgi:hypothetical protein